MLFINEITKKQSKEEEYPESEDDCILLNR